MQNETCTAPELLMRREQLREYLANLGYPLTRGTFAQLCAPSRGEGPPVWGYWGRSPVYRASDGLQWARARLRQTRYRLHPVQKTEETHAS
jgi:hypothetical protein